MKCKTWASKCETPVLKYETLTVPERPSLDLSPGMSRTPTPVIEIWNGFRNR